MRHVLVGFCHQRTCGPNKGRRAQRGMARKRADHEIRPLDAMVIEFFQPIDINEETGPCHAKVHHGDKALAARQHLGV
jgi:hypothetical protein